MSKMPNHANLPDIVLPDEAGVAVAVVIVPAAAVADPGFDPNSTAHFQAKMRRAPVWGKAVRSFTIIFSQKEKG